MKKTILILAALIALVFLVGCDPFGSDATKAYITGTIYVDAAMTIPAEGVAVELIADPDSSAFYSQTVFTNTAGVFFMDVQFYPSIPDEESGAGYVLPTSIIVGLAAHYDQASYIYRPVDEGFVLSPGDTLTVWPISLATFGGGKSR